jgi:spore maturation protein CgeB
LESYAKRLNRAKAWLSTTGPADLVGTRYYEVMALGTTLLVCNRFDKVYDGIIEEDEHCIMFSSVEELEKKIKECLQNPDKMKSIIDRAKEHTLKYHTWDNRAEKITKVLEEFSK